MPTLCSQAYSLVPGHINKGNLRETFFLNQLSQSHQIRLLKKGDFLVNDRYTFEEVEKTKRPNRSPAFRTVTSSQTQSNTGTGRNCPCGFLAFSTRTRILSSAYNVFSLFRADTPILMSPRSARVSIFAAEKMNRFGQPTLFRLLRSPDCFLLHFQGTIHPAAPAKSVEGVSIITSRPALFFGNAMVSLIESSPAKSATHRSNPKAIPPCGGAPYLKAPIRNPNWFVPPPPG